MNPKTDLREQAPIGEATDAGEMIAELAKFLGLPPSALLPVCLYLIGVALGNAAKVVSWIFPEPLNLALGCLVCEDKHGPLARVIDFLSRPIRAIQDAQLRGLSERARKILQEELARMEAEDAKVLLHTEVQGARLNDGATQIAKLQRIVRPYFWVDDARP